MDQSAEHLFVVYKSERIDNWLSAHLGVPCGLGCYSPDSSRSGEATTCVVSGCGGECESKAKLEAHHLKHAEGFMSTHQFGATQNQTQLNRWGSMFQNKPALRTDCALKTVQPQPFLTSASDDSFKSKHSTLKSFMSTSIFDIMSKSGTTTREILSGKQDLQRTRSGSSSLTLIMARVAGRGRDGTASC